MTETPDAREVRVRRADERDVAALAALRRTWAERRGTLAPGGDPGFEQAFAAWWRAERSRRAFWLAEVDGHGEGAAGSTVVGSLNVVEVGAMPSPGTQPERWGYVGNVVVLEGTGARGVPRRLLAAGIAHAHERGFSRLVLRPAASAVAFYRAAGFRPAGEDMVVLETGAGPGSGGQL